MKELFHRVGRIARSHFSSKESPLPPDAPLWEKQTQADPVTAQVSQEEVQYYANLELPVGASFDAIKRQYRTLLQRYHPDRYAKAPAEKQAVAKQVTVQLNAAYEYFQQKHRR